MAGFLVSCTVENGDRWYHEVFNLVLSVRRFGGSLSDAPFVACFVEDVADRYVEGLAELDAEVRVVERFDPRHPPSNKLAMLDLAADYEVDTLLALDTDTVVLGDVAAYARPGHVVVKPENANPLASDRWRSLYEMLGIPAPSRSVVMTASGELTVPYYNSGVAYYPRELCAPLRDAWTKRVLDCLDLYDRGVELLAGTSSNWSDQLALALVLVEQDIPVTHLPVGGNLSTTADVHPFYAAQVVPPFVLHYHNEMDAHGFLFRSRNRVLNPLLDTFNRARAEATGEAYEGLPEPPLVRRALRLAENRSWFDQGPIGRVRRSGALRPVRRLAKNLARGNAG